MNEENEEFELRLQSAKVDDRAWLRAKFAKLEQEKKNIAANYWSEMQRREEYYKGKIAQYRTVLQEVNVDLFSDGDYSSELARKVRHVLNPPPQEQPQYIHDQTKA